MKRRTTSSNNLNSNQTPLQFECLFSWILPKIPVGFDCLLPWQEHPRAHSGAPYTLQFRVGCKPGQKKPLEMLVDPTKFASLAAQLLANNRSDRLGTSARTTVASARTTGAAPLRNRPSNTDASHLCPCFAPLKLHLKHGSLIYSSAPALD